MGATLPIKPALRQMSRILHVGSFTVAGRPVCAGVPGFTMRVRRHAPTVPGAGTLIQKNLKFTAIVLAGSRDGVDPVAEAAGAPCKAVVEVDGTPMVLRVLDALSRAASVDSVLVAGLPEEALRDPVIRSGMTRHRAIPVPGSSTPSATVAQVLAGVPEGQPVLVTTADHALLESGIVDAFAAGADGCGADVAIGLARAAAVFEVAPDTKRTVTRLSDGGYCGTNLFALLTPRARQAVGFWGRMERKRKNPVRMARTLGARTLFRYLTRRLSLGDALARLSDLSGARIAPVLLPFGIAAIDVDKPADLELVRRLAANPDRFSRG